MADEPIVTTFPLPTVVYHYCSQSAALGIIESKCMWLTNQSGLSDVQDSTWATGRIWDHLSRRINEENRERIGNFWKNLAADTPDVYVASFSAASDSLSQWRAYADDGSGFALGFDPKGFGVHQIMTPVLSVVPERTIGFEKVLYDETLLVT